MVHYSRVHGIPTEDLWETYLFERKVVTCELEGLSDFVSTFHLQHILKNQIDWTSPLDICVTRTGAIPEVICRSSTYQPKSVNHVILDYLYSAYDPSRLIKKHLYWPNCLISNFTNGRMFVQLDTALRDHVHKILRDPQSLDPLPTVSQYEDNVMYLGKFGLRDYFDRCRITRLPVEPPHFTVNFIDTGVRTDLGPGSPLYPFLIKGISEEYPTTASLWSIPPLCTEVNLARVDYPPDNLSRIVLGQVEVMVEAQDYTEQGLPIVEINQTFPWLVNNGDPDARHLHLHYPHPLPTLGLKDDFKIRKFSSLHNWSMPLVGQNWGTDTVRVFYVVPGTQIFGIVTRIDTPGAFYIRPLDPAPCPILQRGLAALEFSCGCLWDGHFFRVKTDDPDLRNTRVRVLEPVSRCQPLLHFHEAVRDVTVGVRFVDTGAVDNVSVLQLRKLGQLTASVPPRVALVTLCDGLWYEDSYTELDWRILGKRLLGKTLRLEIVNVSKDDLNGLIRLKVKILSNENGPIGNERKSRVTEIEK